VTSRLSPLNAETMRAAHLQIETSANIGKIVVEAC
jgi:hypothetical protein